MDMKKHRKVNDTICLLFLFLMGSLLFFQLNYPYWYHFLEQYMMFQTTGSFFRERLAEVGGLNEYITEYLTLAFSYPYGASVVITLLLGLLSVLFHHFIRALGVRVSFVFATLPAFLFWMYPLESIAPLVAVVFALSFTDIYTRVGSDRVRYVIGFLFLTSLYFAAAPAHLLFAMLIAVYETCAKRGKIRWCVAAVGIVWALLLPLIAMRTIYILPMREAFLGKHLYHPEYPAPAAFGYVWLSFPVLASLLSLIRNRVFVRKESLKIMLSYTCLLAGIVFGILYGKNPMEQAYRYDYYARQGEWGKIVEHARAHPVQDKDALIYLNLALSHTGRISTDLVRFPQFGEEGLIPYDPKSRMGLIEASEVAWQVVQVNAAQRFAFVGVLSSQRCVQPRLMKRLVETYLVTGEYRAAAKYIKILESTPHYREWAMAQRALLDPQICVATDWVAAKRALLPVTDHPFDLTKTFPSALAYLIDDHAGNRAAFDYGMAYLLLYKDLMPFMHYMEMKRDRKDPLPVLYQEAICLFYAAVQKNPEAFRRYAISPEVQDRFIQFMKEASGLSPATLKERFGDTYYYYAQFTPTPKQRQ